RWHTRSLNVFFLLALWPVFWAASYFACRSQGFRGLWSSLQSVLCGVGTSRRFFLSPLPFNGSSSSPVTYIGAQEVSSKSFSLVAWSWPCFFRCRDCSASRSV